MLGILRKLDGGPIQYLKPKRTPLGDVYYVGRCEFRRCGRKRTRVLPVLGESDPYVHTRYACLSCFEKLREGRE